MTDSRRFGTFAAALALLLLFSRGDIAGQASAARPGDPPDREYRLESSMLGYRGVGGEIDGIRNPTLWARTGETVRITIVNGELMVHDIALEKARGQERRRFSTRARPPASRSKPRRATPTSVPLPGHRVAGHGRPPRGLRRAARRPTGRRPRPTAARSNLDFEIGTLDNWTATGDAFDARQGRWPARGRAPTRAAASAASRARYWVSSGVERQRAQGTLSSAPFRVTQPYASFLVSGGAFTSTRVELVLGRRPDRSSTRISRHRQRPRCARRSSISRPYAGKDIFVRLVDEETGASTATYLKESPWAHINFDQLPLPRREAVLPERDHRGGHRR